MWGNYGFGNYGSFNSTGAINAVIDVQEEGQIYPYTGLEPVSLDFVKNYMKVDFSDDDELIEDLITVSRQKLEKFTGLSFVEKRLTVILNNGDGGIELPYGPTPYTIDLTLIVDINGNNFNQVLITGNQFKTLQCPQVAYVQLTYDTGFGYSNPLPGELKIAICANVFFLYQNRGELLGYESGGVKSQNYSAAYVCEAAKQLAAPFKRNNELSL